MPVYTRSERGFKSPEKQLSCMLIKSSQTGFLNVRKITANNGICSNESSFLKKNVFVFKLMVLLKPYAQPSCLA